MIKKLFWIFIPVIIFSIIGILWLEKFVTISPPDVPHVDTLSLQIKSVNDSLFVCGKSFLKLNKYGLYEMYAEGDAYTRGLIKGKLYKHLLYKQEKTFVDQIQKFVPSKSYQRFLKYLVYLFNRKIDKFIKKEFLEEIYGISQFASGEFDFIGNKYQRMLNYHAAHDIGHMMQNYHLVGCTSFAAWNEFSEDSALIIGRNFDFYINDDFAKNKIVMFVNPDSGYKYVSVTWAGMEGVVSGMNEKGLCITINAAKSPVPLKTATPVTLVARHVLQYAANIQEAYNIAKSYEMFVCESFLVGSAKDHKAVIIEKSHTETFLFVPDTNYLICTNHFQSLQFRNTELNKRQISETPSMYRYERVEELFNRLQPINPEKTSSILRNPYGKNDKNIGYGNEMAINQFIAHHSVIFQPEKGLMWVSASPYQINTFLCYDLKKIFSETECLNAHKELYQIGLSLQSDSLLMTLYENQISRYQNSKQMLIGILNDRTITCSEKELNSLIELNPEYFETYSLVGDYYFVRKNYQNALKYYRKSLEKNIPYATDKNYIMKRLQQCYEQMNK